MPEQTQDAVAVIGLGSMGFGIAQSLLRAGFRVAGCDTNASARERFAAAGGTAVASPAAAVSGVVAVITVVVNAAQTETVLFGPEGAVAALQPGAVVLSSATMSPADAVRLAARCEEAGRPISRLPDQRRRGAGRPGRALRHGVRQPRGLRARPPRARRHRDDAARARRRARHRGVVQDRQPIARGRPYRGGLRGHHLRQAARPRHRQGLRGDQGLGRQFLDVREPRAARADRRLQPGQRRRHLHQGPRHRVRHRPRHRVPDAARRRRAADVPDDRRRPAWAATTTPRSPG